MEIQSLLYVRNGLQAVRKRESLAGFLKFPVRENKNDCEGGRPADETMLGLLSQINLFSPAGRAGRLSVRGSKVYSFYG